MQLLLTGLLITSGNVTMLGMIMGYSVTGGELRGFVHSGIHASGTA